MQKYSSDHLTLVKTENASRSTMTLDYYLASEVDALREAVRKYIAAANPIVEQYCVDNGHRLTDDPYYDPALTALQSFL